MTGTSLFKIGNITYNINYHYLQNYGVCSKKYKNLYCGISEVEYFYINDCEGL